MKKRIERRGFLKIAGTAVAGVPLLIPRSALSSPGRPGANDRIVIGFVGTGGRARQLMNHIPRQRGRIVAVCDFWKRKMIDCVEEKKKNGLIGEGENWSMYDDDRSMFDCEKLDCVFVVTQDHCRTLPAARAIRAGLDVYAEKALTTYIAEGRALVNIVRESKQILQVGSQQRSMRLNEFGCRLVREGKLGNIKVVQACNYPPARRIPDDLPEEPVPEGLNWDAWQGPTGYRPFNKSLLGWMQWSEYAGGEMTNWGAHGVDQIQWALGADDSGPVEMEPHPDGNGKVILRYANGAEVRFELERGPMGGAVFRCERGNLEINRNKLTANPPELVKDAPEADPPEGPTWIARPHIENFFDCMISRERPNADVEIGHRSITVCHLANITRQLGRKLRWDPQKEQFIGDDEANQKTDRPRRAGYEL